MQQQHRFVVGGRPPSSLVLLCLLGALAGRISSTPVERRSPDTQAKFIKELLSWRDLRVDPCDNFYKYACGTKLSEPNTGDYFQNIMATQQLETLVRTKELIDGVSESSPPTFQKAVDAFNACVRSDPSQALSLVVQKVHELGGWPLALGSSWTAPGDTLESLFPTMATMLKSRLSTGLFGIVVMPDPFNTARNLVQFFPPNGFMMPHVQDPLQKVQLARSLLSYVSLIYGGQLPTEAADEALEVVELNNNLWESFGQFSDKIKDNYVTLTISEAQEKTKINFLAYLNEVFSGVTSFTSQDSIVLFHTPYFVQLGQRLLQFSPRTIVNYEMMTTILPAISESGILQGGRARDVLFDIPPNSFELPRPEGSQPRRIVHPDWLKFPAAAELDQRGFTCLQEAGHWFSYAVAKVYHDAYLTSNERERAKKMAENIIRVFDERLDKITWMDTSSKSVAKLKLKYLKETYLYGTWVDDPQLLNRFYDTFDVSSFHMNNFWAANTFMRTMNFRLLGDSVLPLNVTINFDISPMDVNAFYYPADNSINILQGIVQPSIFDDDRLEVFNYAMLGTIIGHEITHGFDNNGQQFGEHGNLRDWMNEDVKTKFLDKASCYVRQYDQYALTQEDFPMVPGFHLQVNGALTLGENIADNGGIQQAFWAYKNWASQGGGGETMPSSLGDYSPEQVFFLTFAHLWCNKYYGFQSEVTVLQTDVHSPGKFRVIGSLSNFDEFSKAFKCDPGDSMNRGDESCTLW